jgi:hypothetical protein
MKDIKMLEAIKREAAALFGTPARWAERVQLEIALRPFVDAELSIKSRVSTRMGRKATMANARWDLEKLKAR